MEVLETLNWHKSFFSLCIFHWKWILVHFAEEKKHVWSQGTGTDLTGAVSWILCIIFSKFWKTQNSLKHWSPRTSSKLLWTLITSGVFPVHFWTCWIAVAYGVFKCKWPASSWIYGLEIYGRGGVEKADLELINSYIKTMRVGIKRHVLLGEQCEHPSSRDGCKSPWGERGRVKSGEESTNWTGRRCHRSGLGPWRHGAGAAVCSVLNGVIVGYQSGVRMCVCCGGME